ncbi:MAG: hypothetical protein EB059_06610 [Alphaproteobacteria bacterium]|nr:hypothetical protein [Alphaproteobacteria bacterium]
MKKSASLLPLTPNTMINFRQEILIDTSLLLQKAVKKQLHDKLPELTQEGRDMSYLAAFEALRMFRHMTHDQQQHYSEHEKAQLAEVEVEWCLDILGRLQSKTGE